METPSQPARRFVPNGLPWVIAGAGLAAYLATLNHWLTLATLPVAAEVNGWSWQPMLFRPVLFLLTRPLVGLPDGGAVLALNVLNAVCAALTLALLARSVALLPHDRLERQRLLTQNDQALLRLPGAWVPVVLAAIALGLRLKFWEHATAASGEMLDLLLFACPIWCLLEYRVDRRRCWLDRIAFLCGVATANSWGLAGFLPLFAVALLWNHRLRFFDVLLHQDTQASEWKAAADALRLDLRFCARMALFGLAGLSLLLLLPLVQALLPNSLVGFWQALGAVAHSYWASLFFLAGTVFPHHREAVLLLAAVSLLPVLVLSLRWRTFTGLERSPSLSLVALAFYLSHAFLLLVCLWAAFDPPFSPGQISRRLGLSLLFLPLDYLGALCVGYYSGFLLLLFGEGGGPPGLVQRALRWTVPKLVYALPGLTLLGLIVKNAPAIRVTNGGGLAEYARLALSVLPPEGAVLLSEDPTRLALLNAALVREGKGKRYLPVDVSALAQAPYRAWLGREYPKTWPEPSVGTKPPRPGRLAAVTNAPLDAAGALRLITLLVRSHRVYYVHPGFGSFLESFGLQPRGLLYELQPYPANALDSPLPTAAELAENEAFWKRAVERGVAPLMRSIRQAERPQSPGRERLLQWIHAQTSLPNSASGLVPWYSGALNSWGVTLQKTSRLSEAARCFALASDLDPDNLPARVNLRCNRNLVAGQKLTLSAFKPNEEQFGQYRNWNELLIRNGPFDDPTFCYQLSVACTQRNLWRQAGQQLERVLALAPSDLNARLAWGNLLNRWRMPDRALQVAAGIRSDLGLQPLDPDVKVELAFLEAEAWFGQTNRAKAAEVLQALLDSRPKDSLLLDRMEAFFTLHGSYTNALRIADQQVDSRSGDVSRLMDKGLLCLLAGDFSNAIPPLTRVLSLTNSYNGRINRALANLRLGRLDAAESDYQEALRAFPTACQPYHGLGEVARAKGETNEALRYYRQFLSHASAGSVEAEAVTARLKELQPGPP